MGHTARGRKALVESGSLKILIEMGLDMSDPTVNIQTTNDERQVALAFLVDAWRARPEVIQSRQHGVDYAESIINSLKKGCRDYKSKGVSFTAISLSFYLLVSFAQDRNMYAPIIFKVMTFILIDCYNNVELRTEITKHFVKLFQDF